MTDRILLTGATSGIGRALARRLAARGHRLVLASRSAAELEPLARDLEVRCGARVECETFDALDYASNVELAERCLAAGDLAGVVLCHGSMHEQHGAERNSRLAWDMTTVNLLSPIVLLEALAPHFEARRRGFLCILSSVAGDRGRRSNALYGAGKAGLDTYLEGLESRLAPLSVGVTTVKPGFVDTQMTWSLPLPFRSDPDRVARDILRGIDGRKSVVYSPGFWRWISFVLRLVPRALFRRLPI